MRRWVGVMGLGAALGLSACAATTEVSKGPSELSARADSAPGALALQAPAAGDLRVVGVEVEVPASLRVSESSSFYPMRTDIVWRGDPMGDRHAQLAAIFDAAGARAVAADQGGAEVIAHVTLERFHGVTERTRFTVGGYYAIHFVLSYRDAATGAPVGAPIRLSRSLPAPGGAAAVALDAAGQTEKVRVTDFLAQVLADEFASPPGSEA